MNVRCLECALAYCRACSDRAHSFWFLSRHTNFETVADGPLVEFSTDPLPPLSELQSVPPASQEVRAVVARYFSVEKLHAFRHGQIHAVRRDTLPSPEFADYHLLEEFLRSNSDSAGFDSLKNQVDRRLDSAVTRQDVADCLDNVLHTLLERKRLLSSRVRRECARLRDEGRLGRRKEAEGSHARVLRANQFFIQALFAFVRKEVEVRGSLRDYLIEDVAEILLLSRHLFFPHRLVGRSSTAR